MHLPPVSKPEGPHALCIRIPSTTVITSQDWRVPGHRNPAADPVDSVNTPDTAQHHHLDHTEDSARSFLPDTPAAVAAGRVEATCHSCLVGRTAAPEIVLVQVRTVGLTLAVVAAGIGFVELRRMR